ncbi:MAG: hypothetical protein WCQ23_05305 [Candidatus Methanomethylophilaceae archaeon]|jgi:hypothetical protein
MSENWAALLDYFSGGIPASEYLWMIVIVAVSIFGFVVARKMVSKI